jgi:sugar (pentulose or hexulose) kinase
VESLPVELRRQVRAIGVTGQMHGVLWADCSGQPLTPYVTWQDARALVPDANWPGRSRLHWLWRHTGVPVRAGYGLAALDWWCARSQWLWSAAWVVGVADWLVWDSCEQSRSIVNEIMAAAGGI